KLATPNPTPPPPPSYGNAPYNNAGSSSPGIYSPPPYPYQGGNGTGPAMQAGSFAPPVQPQQKKGPGRGVIIGVLSLVVLLIIVGTGIFLFTRSRGTTTTQTSGSTIVHLQITPYTYK